MSSEPRTVIQLTNVTREYPMGGSPVPALVDVTMAVHAGEMVAITGPSGSGKSTLMNIIGCLDRPTSGEYRLDDVPVGSLRDRDLATVRNRRIGFVFQSFNLLPRASALRNVELPLLYGNGHHRRTRAVEALERVSLGNRLHHRPAQLSGGEQQRVAIARALVTQPAILLADEPTGNVDSRTGLEIMAMLQELNSSAGMLVLIVTHDPDIAAHCQRVVSLLDGRVTGDGPVPQQRWASSTLQGGE